MKILLRYALNIALTAGKKRFLLTNEIPLVDGSEISEDLSVLTNSIAASGILSGSYDFPSDNDPVTQEVLHFLSDFKIKYVTPSLD